MLVGAWVLLWKIHIWLLITQLKRKCEPLCCNIFFQAIFYNQIVKRHRRHNLLWPGSKFFQIRRYFSKIAGNSADIAVNLLRTADPSLSQRLTAAVFQRKAVIPTDISQKKPVYFLILLQNKAYTYWDSGAAHWWSWHSQGAINGHGNPIAPILGQRWFNDGNISVKSRSSWELTYSCSECLK